MNIAYLDIEGVLVSIKGMFKDSFDYYGVNYTDIDFHYDNEYGIRSELIHDLEVKNSTSMKSPGEHLKFPGYKFDKECVRNLNEFHKITNCVYVVYGSYRKLTIKQLNYLFKINGVNGTVVDKTKELSISKSFTKKYLIAEEILTHTSINNPYDKHKMCIISISSRLSEKVKPLFGNKCIEVDPRVGFSKMDTLSSTKSLYEPFSHLDVIHSLGDIVKNIKSSYKPIL